MVGYRPGPRLFLFSFLFLIGLFLAFGFSQIDQSCLDAADSAYLISSRAIAQGLMPYRDFLAAHPPLLFLLGAPLAQLGVGVAPFRVFSLLLIAALAVIVYRLGLSLSGDRRVAWLAGALSLFSPLGLYFSKLYLNDSLTALLAAATITLLLGNSQRAALAAGACVLLGVHTKLTFLPLLALACLYVMLAKGRRFAVAFLSLAVGGSLAASLLLQLFTGGAYWENILGSQASKGISFSNFYQGLYRIGSMDWPLLAAAIPGLWFAWRALRRPQRGWREQLRGQTGPLGLWLASGLAVLASLPAEGHDTNLFQMTEPAVALLAAWGLVALAQSQRRWLTLLPLAWLVLAVPTLAETDRYFFNRSNAVDVEAFVTAIEENTTADSEILAPGCLALTAQRPVALRFFDQFLWEEKYQRGDQSALTLMAEMIDQVATRRLPVVILADDQPTRELLDQPLSQSYNVAYQSCQWPAATAWLPRLPDGGG